MDNFNFQGLKVPITWVLGILGLLYLAYLMNNYKEVSIGDNWEVTQDWHFNNSEIEFSKESSFVFENWPGSDQTHSHNFHYGNQSEKEIASFNSVDNINQSLMFNNETEIIDTVLISDSSKKDDSAELLEESLETPVVKKPVVKKTKKIIKESKPTIIKNDIVEEIVQEEEKIVEENIEVQEDIVVEDNKVIETIEDKIEVKKVVIEKPKAKDYNSSSAYQKALRKYYKSIE